MYIFYTHSLTWNAVVTTRARTVITDVYTMDKMQWACLNCKIFVAGRVSASCKVFYHVHITVYNTLKYWSLVLTTIIMYFY